MTSGDKRRQAESDKRRQAEASGDGPGPGTSIRTVYGPAHARGDSALRARASLASNFDSFSRPYFKSWRYLRDRVLFRIAVCRPRCGERDALHTHIRGPRRTAHAHSRTETHCTRTFEDRDALHTHVRGPLSADGPHVRSPVWTPAEGGGGRSRCTARATMFVWGVTRGASTGLRRPSGGSVFSLCVWGVTLCGASQEVKAPA